MVHLGVAPAESHPVLIVSFSRSGAPRHLPSFPTRRSSDLIGAGLGNDADDGAGASAILGRVVVLEYAKLRDGVQIEVRSEEHTSELQSRPHLVCRLLLEKKNRRTHRE